MIARKLFATSDPENTFEIKALRRYKVSTLINQTFV